MCRGETGWPHFCRCISHLYLLLMFCLGMENVGIQLYDDFNNKNGKTEFWTNLMPVIFLAIGLFEIAGITKCEHLVTNASKNYCI